MRMTFLSWLGSFRCRPVRTKPELRRHTSNSLAVLADHWPHVERLVFQGADVLDPRFGETIGASAILRRKRPRSFQVEETACLNNEAVSFARMDAHVRESFPGCKTLMCAPPTAMSRWPRLRATGRPRRI
ncbi:uncharacterized protein PG998_000451 [Apiospora kogelbergensis]|uniref:uncharacterized protein n=1 Tax=Apiospora kogelbergensis TaxID=1337665 RepID=UPI00312E5609